MSMNFRLEAKLSQKLVMNQAMQHAIKLLQYTQQELAGHLETAVLENPMLEVAASDESGILDNVEHTMGEHHPPTGEQDGSPAEINLTEMAEAYAEYRSPVERGATGHDELPSVDANLTYQESLVDHLLWQLQLLETTPDLARIAKIIVNNLDGRGYLVLDGDELVSECSAEEAQIALALDMVAHLDPPGCGARTLAECLQIQAKIRFPEDANFGVILGNYLGELEKSRYDLIATALSMDIEDVVEYHKMIRTLEPTPGRGFGAGDSHYITPDVYVLRRGGEWVASLNEDGVPDLRVNTYYKKVMQTLNGSKEEKAYFRDKLQSAEFLIGALQRRTSTIKAVMDVIIRRQQAFFDHGPEYLKPMILQEVADEVERHMSTVSRVTANKYVHTAHGILELKYFFSTALSASGGDDMTGTAIKVKIQRLIDAENPKKPFSDSVIAAKLQDDGITIARRTVAKYREAMGHLSASKRKRLF